MADLRRRTHCTPRKLSSWDGEAIRRIPQLGEIAFTKHLVA